MVKDKKAFHFATMALENALEELDDLDPIVSSRNVERYREVLQTIITNATEALVQINPV